MAMRELLVLLNSPHSKAVRISDCLPSSPLVLITDPPLAPEPTCLPASQGSSEPKRLVRITSQCLILTYLSKGPHSHLSLLSPRQR